MEVSGSSQSKYQEKNYPNSFIAEFFKLATYCPIIAIVLGLVVGLVREDNFIDILVMTWVFVIAILPEGFLFVIIFTYAQAAKRSYKKHLALVKNME